MKDKKKVYIIYESDDAPYEPSYPIFVVSTEERAKEVIAELEAKNKKCIARSKQLSEDYYTFDDYCIEHKLPIDNIDLSDDEFIENNLKIYKELSEIFNKPLEYVQSAFEEPFYTSKIYYYHEKEYIE